MSFKNILNDINNSNLAGVYLFYGNEKYLIDKSLEEIKDAYIDSTNESFNYISYDDFKGEAEQLIDSCETLPFMGSKRLIVVRCPELFNGKRSPINSDDEGKLAKYFQNIPETTSLIFIGDNKIDKRKKIVKEIKKHGKIIEFDKLRHKDLSKWIYKKFKGINKSIELATIEKLIIALGYLDKNSSKTLYDIENEIKKIANFNSNSDTIDSKDINKIVSKSIENNIFSLVDAVAEKNSDEALKIINQMLISGEPEGRILYMIVRQFKILYKVKLMVDRGYTTIAIAPKISLPQYIVKKYLKQANSFTSDDLMTILNKSIETDRNIKTGKMTAKLALEVLITECCII